ncbi:MAG: AIM24 family protein, partial [Candidatus Bathyarchaeota archaeon]|nr:AIM24 family protein [Candidatus Bathyarchaeota archaeon]
MVKCPACGAEVKSDAKFCPSCGAEISTIGEEEKPLEYEIKYRPSYSLLEVQLPPGGFVTAEAGAMTYMSSNIEVRTRTRMKEAGLWGTIKVSLLGGETLFINDYISSGRAGKVGLVSAPL